MSDTSRARSVVLAIFLGWTLDAFEFFILLFVLHNVAETFTITLAITLTLAMRPVGAFVFGWLVDQHGRRPFLIAKFFASPRWNFSPAGLTSTLLTFMLLRRLFGVAMGGEWGINSKAAPFPRERSGAVSKTWGWW